MCCRGATRNRGRWMPGQTDVLVRMRAKATMQEADGLGRPYSQWPLSLQTVLCSPLLLSRAHSPGQISRHVLTLSRGRKKLSHRFMADIDAIVFMTSPRENRHEGLACALPDQPIPCHGIGSPLISTVHRGPRAQKAARQSRTAGFGEVRFTPRRRPARRARRRPCPA